MNRNSHTNPSIMVVEKGGGVDFSSFKALSMYDVSFHLESITSRGSWFLLYDSEYH